MDQGTVRTCVRYPVKSLLGEEVDRVEVDQRGVVADRWWALRTPEGRFGSGKSTRRFVRLPKLLEMSSRLSNGGAVLRLPDGREFDVADPELSPPLSEVVGQPVAVARESDVWHMDGGAVHLVTTASLRWWSEVVGEPVSWRRCRPNFVVDLPGEDRLEDRWVGRMLAVGDAVLEVDETTERCVMIGHGQGALPAVPGLLKSLAGMALTFGVYARVLRPGLVSVGDQVALV
ncbi:MOSC domain-containing protein [Solihabitans fulvus]|uniref:MOSC domain-containing protein n=1 Tax=Solihabitans fulvus TaxID=1892852 RepID=A0A5B2XSY9_9PSEU|nr:MOSC domain-containing protein [Solihabitans fulvus]KAA2266040.1 MOSC domain-containing protein [Solihabitans fulvus]